MRVHLKKSLGSVWSRCYNRVFVLVLLFSICAYVTIWISCAFGAIWSSILVTVAVSALPVVHFFGPPPEWRHRGELLWAVPFAVAVAFTVVAESTDAGFWAVNGALLVIALPIWWIFWRLSDRQWFLATGLMIGGAIWMVYWIFSPLWRENDSSTLLLVPLPFVGLAGIGWLVFAYYSLRKARLWKDHCVRGPAWRLVALCLWFAPAAGAGSVGPFLLDLDAVWSAVSLTIVGIVLGTVVSDPLRYLLLKGSSLSLDRDRWF